MPEICDLGKPSDAFYYTGKPEQLRSLEGHGVALNPKPNGICKDLGMLAPAEVETVVDSSGGVLVEKGDLVVHTPDFCRRGLREAQR
ncbi:hypothetical protein KKE60_04750 [Patescibacteria group bacterium]|nr:hypothetical protein [Patescibacteria group bacterium]